MGFGSLSNEEMAELLKNNLPSRDPFMELMKQVSPVDVPFYWKPRKKRYDEEGRLIIGKVFGTKEVITMDVETGTIYKDGEVIKR